MNKNMRLFGFLPSALPIDALFEVVEFRRRPNIHRNVGRTVQKRHRGGKDQPSVGLEVNDYRCTVDPHTSKIDVLDVRWMKFGHAAADFGRGHGPIDRAINGVGNPGVGLD